MTDMLKPVSFGLNQFCGPSVLSILTGRNTDLCAAAISAVSGQRVIKGVQVGHIIKALERLGFKMEEVLLVSNTLYGLLVSLVSKDGKYMVFVEGHVVAIQIKDKQIYFCDNHSKSPIKAEVSARLMNKVVRAVKVEEPPQLTEAQIKEERLKYLNKTINDINTSISALEARRELLLLEIHSLSLPSYGANQ